MTSNAPSDAAAPRVLLVTGSDLAPAKAAMDFLTLLGLETVEWNGAPSDAAKLLKQLESVGDVHFAVFLLSAQDLAGASAQPSQLLGLGFLLARLGRERMRLLYRGADAVPAPWDVLARVSMDDGGLWPLLLAREMRQAGLQVDLNRAI